MGGVAGAGAALHANDAAFRVKGDQVNKAEQVLAYTVKSDVWIELFDDTCDVPLLSEHAQGALRWREACHDSSISPNCAHHKKTG